MKRLFFSLVCTAILTACAPVASETKVTSTPTVGERPVQTVRLPMGYIPSVQFAPFYIAADKGYFQAEGIAIEFDYKFETDGVALVGAGEIPFAVVSGEQVPLARAEGLPVVYVATWWNGYPVAVMALKDSGIQTMPDLKGKKVGIPALAGASYVGFQALLNATGVQQDELQLDVIGFNVAVDALIARKLDAAVVYANNEPIQVEARGYEVNVIRVADTVDLVSNGLLSNEKTLQEDPALARGMIRAILRGVEETLADPEGAYAICKKFVEISAEQDAVQRQVLAASIEFWRSGTPGYSNPAAWRNMEATLRSMDLLSEPLDITKAFTNDFLPE
jgi:NitT/TauT family transport system substrate-binding protein